MLGYTPHHPSQFYSNQPQAQFPPNSHVQQSSSPPTFATHRPYSETLRTSHPSNLQPQGSSSFAMTPAGHPSNSLDATGYSTDSADSDVYSKEYKKSSRVPNAPKSKVRVKRVVSKIEKPAGRLNAKGVMDFTKFTKVQHRQIRVLPSPFPPFRN